MHSNKENLSSGIDFNMCLRTEEVERKP